MERVETEKELDRLFNKQYLHNGFCAYCGEGIPPLVDNRKDLFGECPDKGHHPDCGEPGHNSFNCSCVVSDDAIKEKLG